MTSAVHAVEFNARHGAVLIGNASEDRNADLFAADPTWVSEGESIIVVLLRADHMSCFPVRGSP